MIKLFKIIKLIFLLPTAIILAIYYTSIYIRLEYFNNDMVEYEMTKYKSGDSTGMKLIKVEMEKTLIKYKSEIYFISVLMWLAFIYAIK